MRVVILRKQQEPEQKRSINLNELAATLTSEAQYLRDLASDLENFVKKNLQPKIQAGETSTTNDEEITKIELFIFDISDSIERVAKRLTRAI